MPNWGPKDTVQDPGMDIDTYISIRSGPKHDPLSKPDVSSCRFVSVKPLQVGSRARAKIPLKGARVARPPRKA